MFGKILKIDNNELTIENLGRKAISSLMNCHIVLEDEFRKVVGEIIYIDEVATAEEREKGLDKMIELALDSIL